MAVGACNRSLVARSSIKIHLAALVFALFAACGAQGVVVVNLNYMNPAPPGGWVGVWYGSSAVPISPYWIMTARHVGGTTGYSFYMRGVQYQAVEIRQHPSLDLQLVRVSTPMPGWHRVISQPVQPGTVATLGGWGLTTTGLVAGGGGWNWSGSHQEKWGRNVIEAVNGMIRTRFDDPAQGGMSNEAAFATNDSGAGLFVTVGGQLELAGTASSVSAPGASMYGSSSYSVNLYPVRDWITSIVGNGGGTPPPTVQDLFAFLSLWFSGSPGADFDQSGVVNTADIFAYLAYWFAAGGT